MNTNAEQIAVIRAVFEAAEQYGVPLWLESGWAIDARLGRVTRAHDDIDIAFAAEHAATYRALLEAHGFTRHETMDYGFLSWRGAILIDSEPCIQRGGSYGFPDVPPGACPLEKQGLLGGYRLRCLSWEAMYVEFLGYMDEVPQQQWRDKDHESLRLIEAQLDDATKRMLRAQFL